MIVAPVASLEETEVCSTTKCHQNKSDLKNNFVQKSFFFNIFYSFNPNHAYWNQRRLSSGNLPGMFWIDIISSIEQGRQLCPNWVLWHGYSVTQLQRRASDSEGTVYGGGERGVL